MEGTRVSTHLCDLPTRGVQKVDQLRPLPLDFQQVSADVWVVFQVAAEVLGGFSECQADLLDLRLDLKHNVAREQPPCYERDKFMRGTAEPC